MSYIGLEYTWFHELQKSRLYMKHLTLISSRLLANTDGGHPLFEPLINLPVEAFLSLPPLTANLKDFCEGVICG